ncbi:MAG TPA: transposase [Ktedonobacterales bacterium]|jgi:transposase
MRPSRVLQSLSYPLRLPDALQADALRLLDTSKQAINTALLALWPGLDEFADRGDGPAWKQVEGMVASPDPHGSRQWRCEAEQVGRILRAQAHRKRLFAQVLPLLSEGLIRPKSEHQRAGKNRKAIRQALADLKTAAEADGGSLVELQSLIEQACNSYLQQGSFPTTYEELQAVPCLAVGVLPYAGDDGPVKGQVYRLSLDVEHRQITLALRCPDEHGEFRRSWAQHPVTFALPEPVAERLEEGYALAPTLREIVEPDGNRYAVLDLSVEVPVEAPLVWEQVERVLGFDWGIRTLVTACAVDLEGHQIGRPFFLDTGSFDGRQARTRRQIDLLKSKAERLEARLAALPEGDERQPALHRRLAVYQRERARCWRKYHARNRDLAHLAANVLLLLASWQGCQVLAGESLKTLKSTGRGRDARGRWRNWRNNSQIRGELWHVLKYKCHLAGMRLEWQRPRGTSHTCPRCGQSAATYRSPDHHDQAEEWGAWLWCAACGWNGSRDYAAALNIARLGAAFLTHYQQTGRFFHPSIADSSVKAVSYTGAAATLRLPSPGLSPRPPSAGKHFCNGWQNSVTLRSSYAEPIMLRLCG